MAKPKIDRNTTTYRPEVIGRYNKITTGVYLMPYKGGDGKGGNFNTQSDIPEELVGWVKQVRVDISNSSISQATLGYGRASDVMSTSYRTNFSRRPDTNSPQAIFTFSKEESKKFFFTNRPWVDGNQRYDSACVGVGGEDPYNFYIDFVFDFRRDDVVSGLSFVSFDKTKKELKLKIEYTHEKPEMNARQKGHYENVYHYLEYYTPIGTKIEVEGKGRTITINNFNGDIDLKRGIKLELWRDAEQIFSPIQIVENIKGLESKAVRIQSLEPSGVGVNADAPIQIQWAATNQISFKVTLNGTSYTGTNEKSLTLPASEVRKGKNTLTLEVFGELSADKKTVTFTGYGKPETPTFEEQSIFNTARPLIRWTSNEQRAYNLKILEGSQIIKSTGDITSTEKSYQVDVNLKNNTTYTLKLKIKSERGIWSDEVSKEIKISFAPKIAAATLNLFENDRGVVTINVSNPQNSSFDYCEIHRKATYEKEWRRIAARVPLEIALNDNLIAANTEYQYKVISYDKQGGSIESAVKTARIKLKSMQFVDLDSMEDVGAGYSDSPDMPFKVRRIQDKAVIKYEGMKAPVTEQGETDYQAITFEFIFKNYQAFKAFQKKSEQSRVIAFRSTQGHLVYGQIVSWGEEFISAVGFTAVTFEFVEVNFIESEIYSSGKTLRVIRLDAGYKLDSGYVIDGVYYEN